MTRVIFSTRIFDKRVRMNFRSLFSAFLLLIYASGTISVDLVHHAIHNHGDSEVHSAIAEKDACHRTIFHQDTKNGCHHQTHVTKVEKCKFSHVVFQAQQLLTRERTPLVAYESAAFFISCYAPLTTTCLQEPHLRGPPMI